MSRRMYARALAVAIPAALIIGVAAGSAAPSDREIQKGNTSCTSPTNGYRSLGVAHFSFNSHSDSVRVDVNIKHGLAKTPYTAILIDADTCTEILTFDKKVGTNAKGKGRRSWDADANGSCSFVVDVYDGSEHAYSEAANYC